MKSNTLTAVFSAILTFWSATLIAEPVRVRFAEGLVHGFLVLRSEDGTTLASGDLTQVAEGNQVTSRLVLRFRDGSLNDELAVFNQRDRFRLLRYRLLQTGTAFKQPLEMKIETSSGKVSVRYKDDRGEEKTEAEHLELPPDLANGILITLLKNLQHDDLPTTVSFLAATPKPRLVKLAIDTAAEDSFLIAGSARKASHYVVKADVGGLTGLVASLLKKHPPDSHIWIDGPDAPVFVKSEAPLFYGGPSWRIELASPVWGH
jgi:hypothetical protein